MIDQQHFDIRMRCRWQRGLLVFNLVIRIIAQKGADFRKLAAPHIGDRIEGRPFLGERMNHLIAERFGQVAQLSQRRLKLGITDVGQLHGGNDGEFGLYL